MRTHDEIDEKLARVSRRLETEAGRTRHELERVGLLPMAEALRETFQGRLTYFRTDAIEIGNRAAFEERGQSYNFDLRGSGTVMPTVPIATLPYRGKRKPERRKAALVKSTPARTWHDRMDEA